MPGETLGLVGESGCGKSTAVNIMLGLLAPDEGQIFLDGKDIGALSLAARVRAIQPVFQDPYSSLNPMRRISDLVAQPLRLHARNVDPAPVVNEMLDRVGLPPRLASAFPAEISGGQRQSGNRTGAGPAAESADLRRADLGSRRVGPGAGD